MSDRQDADEEEVLALSSLRCLPTGVKCCGQLERGEEVLALTRQQVWQTATVLRFSTGFQACYKRGNRAYKRVTTSDSPDKQGTTKEKDTAQPTKDKKDTAQMGGYLPAKPVDQVCAMTGEILQQFRSLSKAALHLGLQRGTVRCMIREGSPVKGCLLRYATTTPACASEMTHLSADGVPGGSCGGVEGVVGAGGSASVDGEARGEGVGEQGAEGSGSGGGREEDRAGGDGGGGGGGGGGAAAAGGVGVGGGGQKESESTPTPCIGLCVGEEEGRCKCWVLIRFRV